MDGKVGAMSGKDGAMSGKDGAVSGEDGAMSGKDGAMSGKDGAMSGKDGAMSGEDGAMSGKDGGMDTPSFVATVVELLQLLRCRERYWIRRPPSKTLTTLQSVSIFLTTLLDTLAQGVPVHLCVNLLHHIGVCAWEDARIDQCFARDHTTPASELQVARDRAKSLAAALRADVLKVPTRTLTRNDYMPAFARRLHDTPLCPLAL